MKHINALTKKVCKDFEIEKIRRISWFVCSKWLLLADVFENCRTMGITIYKLDPAKFVSAPVLAWQAALK